VGSGSTTTKGIHSSGSQPPRGPSSPVAPRGNPPPSPTGQADITARINGATAGVTKSSGQSVFASSTAPRATQPSHAKTRAHSPAKAKRTTVPAVSERSATGDLWGAVSSRAGNPSLASAAAGGESGGLSGGLVAAIAILGLALASIAGGALATAGQRRRAAAGAAKRR